MHYLFVKHFTSSKTIHPLRVLKLMVKTKYLQFFEFVHILAMVLFL